MNKPTLFVMCGLPASGKSTYAKELALKYNAKIFSSDELREEMLNNVNNQEHNTDIFIELHRRIKSHLSASDNAIYDATNINSKKRRAFISELKNIPCIKECHIIATPYEECLRRNKERDRVVPEDVIKRMYLNWNTPYWFEGWDDIIVHCDAEPVITIDDWLDKYMDYNQDNSHHTMTLGEHCKAVGESLKEDILLYCAGSLHDCQKPFVKSFVNSKGEITEQAHYYQHHCPSGYDALFFEYPNHVSPLDVSILVNLHMQPYFWKEEKTYDKYKSLWGKELYDNIMKLHEADEVNH